MTGTARFENSVAGIAVHGQRTTIVDNLVSGNRVDGIFIQGADESIVQGKATDPGAGPLVGSGDGVSDRGVIIRMKMSDLVGRASHAPGASHVGVQAVPAGPLAARARPVSHG